MQIARSWFNFIQGDIATKQLMFKRLEVCDKCTEKVQIDDLGKVLIQVINEEASTFQCGKCNCPLASKTAHPANECPLGKWKKAGDESYF